MVVVIVIIGYDNSVRKNQGKGNQVRSLQCLLSLHMHHMLWAGGWCLACFWEHHENDDLVIIKNDIIYCLCILLEK